MTGFNRKTLALIAGLFWVHAPAIAEECPGFGSWKFGGLDVTATGETLASMLAVAPPCAPMKTRRLSGDCKAIDGINYIVERDGNDRRIVFKLRPIGPNERLPFDVLSSDSIDQVAGKLLAANANVPMYGFSSLTADGKFVRNRRVSVEVLCDRGEGASYFFGYWFDDGGLMTAVYVDAFLSRDAVYAPDVTFFTRRIER